MNERDYVVSHWTVDLIPERKRYDTYNQYPYSYVEIQFLTDEEKEARRRKEENAQRARMDKVGREFILSCLPVNRCARCQREIKPQYTHCYRCNNYLKVKARIAA